MEITLEEHCFSSFLNDSAESVKFDALENCAGNAGGT
jgi:hypothetical protein